MWRLSAFDWIICLDELKIPLELVYAVQILEPGNLTPPNKQVHLLHCSKQDMSYLHIHWHADQIKADK